MLLLGYNLCILIGQIENDVMIHPGETGSFKLAIDELAGYREDTDEPIYKVTYLDILVEDTELIRLLNDELEKGDYVLVQGRIVRRQVGQNGRTGYRTEIIADYLQGMIEGQVLAWLTDRGNNADRAR